MDIKIILSNNKQLPVSKVDNGFTSKQDIHSDLTLENLSSVRIDGENYSNLTVNEYYINGDEYFFSLRPQTLLEEAEMKRAIDLAHQLKELQNATADLALMALQDTGE